MNYGRLAAACAAAMVLQTAQLWAHCEIPCGIYGDELRFSMIEENIATVEKSMKKIVELSGDDANANQVARWVDNKEKHADDIREIVTQYFLTQRIKLPSPESGAQAAYKNKLALPAPDAGLRDEVQADDRYGQRRQAPGAGAGVQAGLFRRVGPVRPKMRRGGAPRRPSSPSRRDDSPALIFGNGS